MRADARSRSTQPSEEPNLSATRPRYRAPQESNVYIRRIVIWRASGGSEGVDSQRGETRVRGAVVVRGSAREEDAGGDCAARGGHLELSSNGDWWVEDATAETHQRARGSCRSLSGVGKRADGPPSRCCVRRLANPHSSGKSSLIGYFSKFSSKRILTFIQFPAGDPSARLKLQSRRRCTHTDSRHTVSQNV